ncbi:hypothetical protein FBEOM_9652 [Fusarium beomiforme]|uniref:Uncharacterized protein n=1 Tax=Fusarium beomiforme TaxID=44412 RepID=A0A9P5ACZ2_9HYPO|nr:hypothetical protein FBEOM_9652 [Fusarium beomiforme]
MSSSSTFSTITPYATGTLDSTAQHTLDATTEHSHGNPNTSDKIAIIGITVGMAINLATMTNTIHRRMSDSSAVIAIAVTCTAIFLIFLAAALFCNWRSRPKSPSGTRAHDHEDSDANSEVELGAIPDGALNHPLVHANNGAGHEIYPAFESTRERHASQN